MAFESGFLELTEKVKSKYRPVATISQIDIVSHAPVVLVGECLPQALLSQPIKQTLVVTGGGENALNILSDLLGQCGKIGSNLNQLARHFNSGGKDSEQIQVQLLTELSALTLFRLDAEKKMGELYSNHQAYKLEELRSNST